MKSDERVLLCLERTCTTSAVDDEDEGAFYVSEYDDDVMDYGRSGCRRALLCPTLIGDNRVLNNLLIAETNCRPPQDCLAKQADVQSYMRDVVTSWMLEVRAILLFFAFFAVATGGAAVYS
jgi:hypothetical protein